MSISPHTTTSNVISYCVRCIEEAWDANDAPLLANHLWQLARLLPGASPDDQARIVDLIWQYATPH